MRVNVMHRLAIVTALCTLLLIVAGGVVTNTGAALAVPDWPTTFGYNMFLFPWSRMVGGVLYEHSHRLIGALVGLFTVALAVGLWRRGRTLRWLGVLAVAAVVAQGVLGGLRVVLVSDTLAVFHGALAQAFFGLVSALVWFTSPAAARLPRAQADPSVRVLTLVATGLVYVQIVFGSLLAHAGLIDLHLIGALAVYVVVPMVTARLRRIGDPVAAPLARALLVALALQLVLGVGSLLPRVSSITLPGGLLVALLVPVLHRVVGSLTLGLAVVLSLRMTAPLAEPAWARLGAPLTPLRGNAP